MIVTITQKDIYGRPYLSTSNCPLAEAIRRILPNTHIRVGTDFVMIGRNEYHFDNSKWNYDIYKELKSDLHPFINLEIPNL